MTLYGVFLCGVSIARISEARKRFPDPDSGIEFGVLKAKIEKNFYFCPESIREEICLSLGLGLSLSLGLGLGLALGLGLDLGLGLGLSLGLNHDFW
jgi:hypothetical protein